MARTVKTRFKQEYRATYIKAWRKFRGMTQEQLAQRVSESTGRDDFSHASVGRIENGKQPYSQPVLEAMADALQTDVASLLIRDPGDPEGIWSIWDHAKPGERREIVGYAKGVVRKAG